MVEFWRSTALPHVEARRSCQVNSCYRQHAHDAFSIGLIDEGTSILSGPIEGVIHLEAGDVVVIPAGQVHACNPEKSRWLYQMIHVDQGWAASLSAQGESSPLFTRIAVLRRPHLRDRVADLLAGMIADDSREGIMAAFGTVLTTLEAGPAPYVAGTNADPELLVRLRPVLERLRHDSVNPTLDALAATVGMSRHQFDRAMRRATGLTPLAWRQNARVVEARHLLRSGMPIAEAACALGFTDQSLFHRVFRAHVAATPGAYQG